jgi:hypothetical protein
MMKDAERSTMASRLAGVSGVSIVGNIVWLVVRWATERRRHAMVTFEDVTEMFLAAAESTGLSAHPESWLNVQTLEREFSCTLHPGPCEEAEHRATCQVSFGWGPLDTVLSVDGAESICEFMHEPDEDCPHLHTENVPPLDLDLTYSLPLDHMRLSELNMQNITRSLKLRASEHSSRAVETQPTISLTLGDGAMEADLLALQQHVELPLWDPEGMSGFRSGMEYREGHFPLPRSRQRAVASGGTGATPHPEDWLPSLFNEVLGDIMRVVEALENSRTMGRITGAQDN